MVQPDNDDGHTLRPRLNDNGNVGPNNNRSRNNVEENENSELEEMERMLALQEPHDQEVEDVHHHDDDEANFLHFNADDQENVIINEDEDGREELEDAQEETVTRRSYLKVHYTALSLLAASVHILYILRTRRQVYLSLLYLTSSKISYILIGNAILSLYVSFFYFIVNFFLNGLRLTETENIAENIRWNVTETCIALAMFRPEVDVKLMGMFLVLILGKCLHWAVELRGSHLRMTEEVFYFLHDEGSHHQNNVADDDTNEDEDVDANSYDHQNRHDLKSYWLWKTIGLFLPSFFNNFVGSIYKGAPRVRYMHFKFYVLVVFLLIIDIVPIFYCSKFLIDNGASVHILFGFESALLMVSAMSTISLYQVHVWDGVVNILQRMVSDQDPTYDENIDSLQPDSVTNQHTREGRSQNKSSMLKVFIEGLASTWREHRTTLTFTIDLLAHAAKFFFYLIFFAAVYSSYGVPLNVIREVYMSYQKFRSRLSAYASYRLLTRNMEKRFKSVETEEELDEVGRLCIICRDQMEIHGVNGGCKRLPGCGHCFHKHCLREWLVQQQTCPTCRGDIQANESRARLEEKEREEEMSRADDTDLDLHIDGTNVEGGNQNENNISADDGDANGSAGNNRDGDDTIRPSIFSQNSCEIEIKSVREGKTRFPCLYRVSAPTSTSVMKSASEEENESSSPYSRQLKVIRSIPAGKLLVCTQEKRFDYVLVGCNAAAVECSSTLLKIPDGWVKESDLERLVPLDSFPGKTLQG